MPHDSGKKSGFEKVVKTKYGVKTMGLKGRSSASPRVSQPSKDDPQEVLNIQPLQHHAPAKVVKADLPKKKFKTRTSGRYRHSLRGGGYSNTDASIVVLNEEEINVDEIIGEDVNTILEEVVKETEAQDVATDVETSGMPETLVPETLVDVIVVDPVQEVPQGDHVMTQPKDVLDSSSD